MTRAVHSLLLCLLLLFAAPSSIARPIVADANPRKINIDHNFKGLNVLVYGAREDAGNIVVVVRGPKHDQVLRRKGKVLGVWTNVENFELSDLSSFYAVASMRPLATIQNDTLLEQLEVGVDNVSIPHDYSMSIRKHGRIKESVIELMQNKGLYTSDDYDISFWGETLFRTFITFPKNISYGTYNIDVYLFNNGLLTSFQTMPIIVEKVGFEAFLHNFAYSRPLLYGCVSVIIALSIGLIVGTVFARR